MNAFPLTAVFAAAGVIAGVVLGWILARWRAPAGRALEEELRRRLAEQESRLQAAATRENEHVAQTAAAQAERDAAKALLADQKAAQEKALTDLRESFKALSAEALNQNAPVFLRLAKESFESLRASAQGDLTQRQEAISGLLKPLEEHLKTYQQRLQQSETAQATVLGEVKQKLETLTVRSESLAQETERFRAVLQSNQARGRWGEETLRRVVEAAGMSAHCDFAEQAAAGDGQPDMIVRLPGDRVIVVDAKTPDLDFLSAAESADLEKRKRLLEEHAAKLKQTIKALAARNYPAQFSNALDHVVLFLPAESLFSAALEGDRDLIVWAANRKIMLATPASLIALLRAVSLSWAQQRQSENARAIADAAQTLYERVTVLIGHFSKIGDGLAKAGAAFNQAVASYETRVRPSGERLAELREADGGRALDPVEPVANALRMPAPGGPEQ